METASSAAPPGRCGSSAPAATAPGGGFDASSSMPNASTTTPTSPVITASSRRNPCTSMASTANVATPASSAETPIDTPNSKCSPSAAPVNSARSVAIATASACSHRPTTNRRGSRARHTSGSDCPVAMPSLADSVWMSIANRFAVSTTQPSA